MKKEEYDRLVDKLIELAKSYYQDNESKVSDSEYDKLYQEAKKYEEEHPEDVRNDSPTQNVGHGKSKELEINKHPTPMYSLDNCFNFLDLEEFYNKVKGEVGDDVEFTIMSKYDGLSLNAIYKNGKLVKALTRGDGSEGEDVTHNAKYIEFLHPHVPMFEDMEEVELRGEVVMFKSVFEKVNEELEKEGERRLSNPRNAASGTLRQTNPNIVKKRTLCFMPFAIVGMKDQYDALMSYYKENKHYDISLYKAKTLEEIKSKCDSILEHREEMKYVIDGVVISVSSKQQQDELGYNIKAPKFATAYKFKAIERRSKLLDVKWQVGKSGVISPVAIIEPVNIDGSNIERVSLHNGMFIYNLDLKLGDEITIIKSGEIIPKIVNVHKEKRKEILPRIPIPDKCPCCGGEVSNGGGVNMFCMSPSSCPDAIKRQIEYFFERDCVDVDGIGENTVNALYDGCLLGSEKVKLTSPLDYYRYAEKKLPIAYTLGDKQYSINLSNTLKYGCELWRVINGLSIPSIGATNAKRLAKAMSIDYEKKSFSVDTEILDKEMGTNSIARLSLDKYLKEKREYLTELIMLMKPVLPEKPVEHPLNGAKICLTGTFKVTRNKIVELLTKLGVSVSENVTSRVDVVLAGENPSSKIDKAMKLKIRMIDLSREERILEKIESFEIFK